MEKVIRRGRYIAVKENRMRGVKTSYFKEMSFVDDWGSIQTYWLPVGDVMEDGTIKLFHLKKGFLAKVSDKALARMRKLSLKDKRIERLLEQNLFYDEEDDKYYLY